MQFAPKDKHYAGATTNRNHQAQFGHDDIEKMAEIGYTRIKIEQVTHQGKGDLWL
jgi:hypothetical protein